MQSGDTFSEVKINQSKGNGKWDAILGRLVRESMWLSSAKTISDRGNNKYKGPQARAYLLKECIEGTASRSVWLKCS